MTCEGYAVHILYYISSVNKYATFIYRYYFNFCQCYLNYKLNNDCQLHQPYEHDSNKMNTVGTILNSNRNIVVRGKIDTLSTHVHDRSLFWIDTDTSIKRGGF